MINLQQTIPLIVAHAHPSCPRPTRRALFWITAYRLTHEALEKERALLENLRGAGYVRAYVQLDSGRRRGNYETKIMKAKPNGNLLELIRAGVNLTKEQHA